MAAKIQGCGSEAARYRCGDCGHTWDVAANCWHRLCPRCAPLRARRLLDVHRRLAGHPNLKHLVLTLRSERGLGYLERANGRVATQVDWIMACFRRLRNRKLFRQAWRGGVYAIEFTYSAATGWHVHLHALVDGAYVPQAVISVVWLELTGSSDVVWIAWAKRSSEVLKYILKPSQALLDDPLALDDFLGVVERRHLVSGWGKWYRVTERSLVNDVERRCPACGSTRVLFVGRVCVDRGPP